MERLVNRWVGGQVGGSVNRYLRVFVNTLFFFFFNVTICHFTELFLEVSEFSVSGY